MGSDASVNAQFGVTANLADKPSTWFLLITAVAAAYLLLLYFGFGGVRGGVVN